METPGLTAIYFVVSMTFAIHEISKEDRDISNISRFSLLFILYVSPWIVAATGSRVGRISLVVLVVAGLLWKPVRRATLIMFPSSFAATLLMLDFQSFPSAVKFIIGHILPDHSIVQQMEGLRLTGRFFDAEERGELFRHAISMMVEAPLINQLFGMGYGVSGYSSSPYPRPHNQFLGMIVEIGIFGSIALALFWFVCGWRIFFAVPRLTWSDKSALWVFFVSLIAIFGLAISYQITTKGLVLVFLFLMFSWSGTRSCKLRK